MAISLVQHRRAITQASIAKFFEDTTPKMGLSTFFTKKTTRAKGVSIEVQRMRQLVAPDVQRCTDPVRVTFSKSTEKIYVPPYYNLMFDFTACQGYDESFGMGIAPSDGVVDTLIDSSAKETIATKNMILRAIEVMHSTLLQTGTITLKNADSIDFKRLAGSMVVNSGTKNWDVNTATRLGDLKDGGIFLRNQGQSVGNEINAIFGSTAMDLFLLDDAVNKERGIYSNFRRADIGMPALNEASGLTFYGRVASGDFVFNLWTYSDTYELPNGTKAPYIDPLNVVLIAPDFQGIDAYAGIPTVFNPNTDNQYLAPMEGDFIVTDMIDQKKATWDINVKSAPLPIPVTIDKVYTLRVKS